MPDLRVVFMGTAELACASLEVLCGAPDLRVVAVVTQPDKPRGRELKLQPTPVKVVAVKHELPVHQPLKARAPEFVDQLRGLAPDLIVVAAYGQILPQSILDIPKHGCLNVHTSLLPKYRGAAPIQWAILNGELETGVTIMKMDAGLDTGDIVAEIRTPIGGHGQRADVA
jgi:methionyl-tRNA formyltransferase